MVMQRDTWFGVRATLLGLLTVACLAAMGCQVDMAGMTLPSPYYLTDDVQYFPAGPEFQLTNEAAAMKAYSAEDELANP